MEKFIAVLLGVTMLLTMLPLGALSVSASSRSQEEAVEWIKNAVGQYWDYDYVWGAQCVDIIRYYYEYLGVTSYHGNANMYANAEALPNDQWKHIQYYDGFVAQPGDIAVFLGPTGAGHIALVISADANEMYVVDQNYTEPYEGTDNARATTYSYGQYSFYGVIRPAFTSVAHQHKYTEYVYDWEEHPHYACYRCSCGDVALDYSETNHRSDCDACNVNAGSVIEQAYALSNGSELSGTYTLSGQVTSICTEYTTDGDYITIMLTVPGWEGMPLMCYQLQGAGVSGLAIGDTATVTGTIGHYNWHVQFTTGCKLVSYTPGHQELVDPPSDPATIVQDAFDLLNGMATPYIATLIGTVTAINEVYSDEYGTICLTMQPDADTSKRIYCYRATGEDAAKVKTGDRIQITGRLQNFFDTVEFNYRSTLVIIETKEEVATLTVAQAIELGSGQAHNVYTVDKYYVTGVVSEVYNETYGNMRITDADGNVLTLYGTYNEDGTVRYDGMETKPEVGETIIVYGVIGQYNGTPQMKNGWIQEIVPNEPDQPDYTFGDSDGDGEVNLRDVALLQQYLAGWDVTLIDVTADANGDGDVNLRDVALLQQYLAGWDVELGG